MLVLVIVSHGDDLKKLNLKLNVVGCATKESIYCTNVKGDSSKKDENDSFYFYSFLKLENPDYYGDSEMEIDSNIEKKKIIRIGQNTVDETQ